MVAAWPPVTPIRWDDTHRLIPDAYAGGDRPILAGLAGDGVDSGHDAPGHDAPGHDDVDDLVALAGATNRRLLVQAGRIPSGIHVDELVFGVPEWPIVNAAYCYAHPQGARFNGPDRGAWYAGAEVATSLAEVGFHKTVELAETGYWDLSLTYQDFLADFHGPFHDLRGRRDQRTRACLSPTSYVASQALAERLLDEGSLGIVYPAVRHPGGEAIACLRPALVNNVRRGERYTLTWTGSADYAVVDTAPS